MAQEMLIYFLWTLHADNYGHSNRGQGWIPWDLAGLGQGRLFRSRDTYRSWEDG